MPSIPISSKRLYAVAIAALTAVILALRVALSISDGLGVLAALSQMSQYFTILTNLLLLLVLAWIGAGRDASPRLVFAIVTSITGVSLVYHLLLAQLWAPQGWILVADQGLHTVTPVLALIWWFAYCARASLGWRDVCWAILWPLLYCIYALFRAEFSGFYPYPFIDLALIGGGRLLVNLVGLSAGFLILGAALLGIGKAKAR